MIKIANSIASCDRSDMRDLNHALEVLEKVIEERRHSAATMQSRLHRTSAQRGSDDRHMHFIQVLEEVYQ